MNLCYLCVLAKAMCSFSSVFAVPLSCPLSQKTFEFSICSAQKQYLAALVALGHQQSFICFPVPAPLLTVYMGTGICQHQVDYSKTWFCQMFYKKKTPDAIFLRIFCNDYLSYVMVIVCIAENWIYFSRLTSLMRCGKTRGRKTD